MRVLIQEWRRIDEAPTVKAENRDLGHVLFKLLLQWDVLQLVDFVEIFVKFLVLKFRGLCRYLVHVVNGIFD